MSTTSQVVASASLEFLSDNTIKLDANFYGTQLKIDFKSADVKLNMDKHYKALVNYVNALCDPMNAAANAKTPMNAETFLASLLALGLGGDKQSEDGQKPPLCSGFGKQTPK